jgi:hypothetical protein
MKPMSLILAATPSPAEVQVINRFYHAFQSAETTIACRPFFMQRVNPRTDIARQTPQGGVKQLPHDDLSFMPIVDHPEGRVVLKPGQVAKIHAKDPIESKQHLNNIILILGTPYGVVVLHGREKEYRVNGKGIVEGPIPHLHTTGRFTRAAMRFFKRKGMQFRGDWDLKNWIFSDSFEKDLIEQVELDRKEETEMAIKYFEATGQRLSHAGQLVGDGLLKRIRQAHPANQIKPKAGNTHDVKREIASKKLGDHPLDILPCRANGFKGTRYADQTPAQKAAGRAMLAKPEEVLASVPA